MKKSLLLIAVYITTLSVYAQTNNQPSVTTNKNNQTKMMKHTKPASKEMEDLLNQINLTDSQKIKIQEIRYTYKVRKSKIRKDTTLSPYKKRDKLMHIEKQENKNIEALLTPDQKQKLADLQQKQMIEKTAKFLTLTPEQTAKFAEAHTQFMHTIEKIKMDSMSPYKEVKGKIQEANKYFRSQLKTFLSDLQYEKYLLKKNI